MAVSLVVTIGSLQFHGMQGRIIAVRNYGETFARLGQTGSGAQILGARAPQSRISCWRLFDTAANAAAFGDQVEDLPYSVVASNDPLNGSFDRLRIIEAEVAVRAGRSGSGSTVYNALLTASLTVEPLL